MRETIHSIWLWHYSHSSHPCCNLQFFTILQMIKFENCPIHKVDVRENRNSNLYRRSRALHWSPKQLIVLSCTAVYCTVPHDTEKIQGSTVKCRTIQLIVLEISAVLDSDDINLNFCFPSHLLYEWDSSQIYSSARL